LGTDVAAELCAIKMVGVQLIMEQNRQILRGIGLSSSSHHKNITYRPAAGDSSGDL